MQDDQVMECGEGGYMCPRHTLLSGVWNLLTQVDYRAAIEADDDDEFIPPMIWWDELTPTEKQVIEEGFIGALSQMAETAARVAQIHREHKETK